MIVFESRKQRRVVLQLEPGEELVASLRSVAEQEKVRAAWVRGAGALRWVELDRHDQARRRAEPPQRFGAPCELCGLDGSVFTRGGSVEVELRAVVSRRTDNGVDVLAGRLVAADVFAVQVVLEVYEDVRLEGRDDDRTGLALWSGPSRPGVAAPRAGAEPGPSRSWTTAPAPDLEELDEDEEPDEDDDDAGEEAWETESPSGGGVSWADVAAVSAAEEVSPPPRSRPSSARRTRKERSRAAEPMTPAFRPPPIPEKRKTSEAEFLDEPLPVKGDWIQHRQFGLCRVDREDGEGGIVIRLPSGVRKTIKLDFMEVGQPRMEGKKRVYPIRPRRR